jgi:S1-C subfamily serine protease
MVPIATEQIDAAANQESVFGRFGLEGPSQEICHSAIGETNPDPGTAISYTPQAPVPMPAKAPVADDSLEAPPKSVIGDAQHLGNRFHPVVWVGIGMAVMAVLALLFAYTHRNSETPLAVSEPIHAQDRTLSALVSEPDRAKQRTLSADEIYARKSPSVVQVVARDEHDRVIKRGSGFLVSTKGLIATNHHVVEGAHTACVILVDEAELPVMGVAAFDEDADIAIIKVANGLTVRPLELSSGNLPAVGVKVYAIGNPLGLANSFSDGLVSGHREIDHVTWIQTTTPISPGSSGGPLLCTDGQVVGVTTFKFRDGENLNFAVSSTHVAKMLLRCEDGKLTQLPTRLPHNPRISDSLSSGDYFDRGNTWMDKGELDKAIKDYDEAIRLSPKAWPYYNNRGNAWMEKGNFENAIKDYGEAIRLNPSPVIYNIRGYALLRNEQFELAIEDLDEAVRLLPKFAQAYFHRGDAYFALQKYDKAVDSYKAAYSYGYPDPGQCQFNIGRAYSRGRKYQQAIPAFEKARALGMYAEECEMEISRCQRLMRNP